MLDGIDSDLEDEEEKDEARKPKVTHFDKPTSVTFGGRGSSDSVPPRIPSSDGCFSWQQSTDTVSPRIVEELTRNGGKSVNPNTGEIERMWSQTRDEVVISILVPARTLAADFQVKFISEDTNMIQMMGSARPTLSVKFKGKPLLKRRLAHYIQVEDEEEEINVDWYLEDFDASHRCLKVGR